MSGKETSSSKKLKSVQPKEELKATWMQDFTDFTIALASGQELRCHKLTLAQHSSVFATMLKSELAEGKTNRMKLDHFDDKTVFHFLEYIHAKIEYVESYYSCSYKKDFQEEKLTVELLKMAHMYNVKDLLKDCTRHLKGTITESNVLKIWRVATKTENATLRSAVVEHLKQRKTEEDDVLEFLDALEGGVGK